ncbi:hypothetical protein [Halarchaeum sp. P4]|uniref:hypothetical protein n=1 Tax=Halarchaeum sp. P4 TaxID=3421639 RepID=UPI003EB6BB3E
MILVAGSEPSVAAALSEERVHVDAVDDLPDPIPADAVLLVDPDGVADVDALVAAARERADGPLTVVAVSDAPLGVDRERYDAVVSPDASAESVRSAVEHARHLASYRGAVSDLYEECRRGERPETRGLADSLFEDLGDLDAADIAALLREEGAGEE